MPDGEDGSDTASGAGVLIGVAPALSRDSPDGHWEQEQTIPLAGSDVVEAQAAVELAEERAGRGVGGEAAGILLPEQETTRRPAEHDLKMAIHRMELSRLEQQSVDLLCSEPWIGGDDRSHVDPIGPGLGNEGIGLQLV